MNEEIIVNYENTNEIEKTINDHKNYGFFLMRHNTERKQLYFKKIPLESDFAKVIE